MKIIFPSKKYKKVSRSLLDHIQQNCAIMISKKYLKFFSNCFYAYSRLLTLQ